MPIYFYEVLLKRQNQNVIISGFLIRLIRKSYLLREYFKLNMEPRSVTVTQKILHDKGFLQFFSLQLENASVFHVANQ